MVQLTRHDWFKRLLYATPVVAWAAVLFWLSDRSLESFQAAESRSGGIPRPDYLVHGVLYFVLGGLAWLWLRMGIGLSKGMAFGLAVALAVLYGVSDEWHQSFVPGRTPDAMDVVADGLGATAACLVLWFISGLRKAGSSAPRGEDDGVR